MATASEADVVVVADTGSTDGTVDTLRRAGAAVHRVAVKPWRFDDARNASLALVPDDIDVCLVLDMDEVVDAGWRAAADANWVAGTNRGSYLYVWSHGDDGSPGVSFRGDRMHSRFGFRWVHPCHEVLVADRMEESIAEMGFAVHHWPDPSKSRDQYLPLLELAAAEKPDDPRVAHYLGREYHYRGMWQEAVEQLRRHLSLPGSAWAPERAASYRFLTRAMIGLGRYDDALEFARRASVEAPYLREGWLCRAQTCHDMGLWQECLDSAQAALGITERLDLYLTEPSSWGPLPYDLAGVAAWNLGRVEEALTYCKTAATLDPHDTRLAANLTFLRSVT